MKIQIRSFGITRDGQAVSCCRMEQDSGAWAEVLSYGATLRALAVPDQYGNIQSVCHGYETLAEYEDAQAYSGAVVGRCAGRISQAKFTLNQVEYRLPANENDNHLHGGKKGFDCRVWQMEPLENGVLLRRVSADGEEGYPGEVEVTVTYTFDSNNTLRMQFDAVPKADTVTSLTHHGYWNLAGKSSDTVGEHWFSTSADQYVPIQQNCLPTGELLPVQHTPFDFSRPKMLKQGWDSQDDQIKAAHGYDHSLLVSGQGLRPMCRLYHTGTGISMQVNSTLPAIHIYTGNFLQPVPRSAVALEAQFIPDAPNHPDFPSVLVKSGEHWAHITEYQFSILE